MLQGYTPVYPDKESYFRLMDGLSIDVQAVSYEDDGKVMLNLT